MDAPLSKHFTTASVLLAKPRHAGSYITSFFNNPTIAMPSSYSSFNRSWVSQKNLMHHALS
jgi:hypothetical protein